MTRHFVSIPIIYFRIYYHPTSCSCFRPMRHTHTAHSVLVHQPATTQGESNACSDGLCSDWWTTTSFCPFDVHTIRMTCCCDTRSCHNSCCNACICSRSFIRRENKDNAPTGSYRLFCGGFPCDCSSSKFNSWFDIDTQKKKVNITTGFG